MIMLNGCKVIEIWWLSGNENFVNERNDFIAKSVQKLQASDKISE